MVYTSRSPETSGPECGWTSLNHRFPAGESRPVAAPRPPRDSMLYRTLTTLTHAVFRLLFTLEYYGEENVPDRGAVIVAGNHPSYLDPVLLSLPLDRQVFFMAWDRLFA